MEKLPPLWVIRIERQLRNIAGNWLPITVSIVFILCFIGAVS